MGPEAMMMWGPLAAVMKASLRAAGRVGAERVGEVLDRARHELEELTGTPGGGVHGNRHSD